MPLTKQYLRFAPTGVFGIVASKNCNAVFLNPQRFVATGGTNVVTLWDTRFQRKVRTLNCETPAVVLRPNAECTLLAVGQLNGAVSIFDIQDKSDEASPEPNVTFAGHKSEVTCITWDDSGTVLASGAKDKQVIIWDCVSETGIVKLKSHVGPVTQVRFWKDCKYLLSSSLDATVRLWDLLTHQCVHTIACNTQVWDIDVWADSVIVAELHLRLFTLTDDNDSKEWKTEELGSVLRQNVDRPTSIRVMDDLLFAVGAKSSQIEVFTLSDAATAEKRRKKRLKKDPNGPPTFIIRDLIKREDPVSAAEGKIKSIDSVYEKDIIQILCCLPSNQLQLVNHPSAEKSNADQGKRNREGTLGFDGHRKIVRGIAFSSDKTAILTASADCFKLWNRSMMGCTLTIDHDFPVVCCRFCPGDRHFVAGTTDGLVILGELSSGSILQTENIGSDNIWGIDVFSNNMGFVASNGKILHFYDFFMADAKLTFESKRQLDVEDTVMCVKISPDMKFIAAGLLSNIIKVFYLDTLKYHLSMYGHNLPVVSIDISSDNTLLASCSGDKTVRVWGMDFGDCHCSMAHTEGLVGCSFFNRTHQLVSVAKDSINFYDTDIHQRIQTVKGHFGGGATCMAIGGFFVATSGRDQSIRLYHRTQEILVLDDEREQEREEELEKEATTETTELATLKTAESEKATDRLIEALHIFEDKMDSSPVVEAYGAKDHKEYIMKVLTGIKAVHLDHSLKLLPVAAVHAMIPAVSSMLQDYPMTTELGVKCLYGLLRFHLATFSDSDKRDLEVVAKLVDKRVRELNDTIGFNLAGLRMLWNEQVEKDKIQTFREMIGERKRRRKKKERTLKRALLAI